MALIALLTNPYFAVPVLLIVLYLLWYRLFAVKKPELHHASGHFANFIQANCPSSTEPYWPSLWCFQSHWLTLFSIILRQRLPKLRFNREVIVTPDGGEVSIDWYDPEGTKLVNSATNTKPIVLFLPGLTGHSHAEYFRTLIPHIARTTGVQSVVLNYRGLGQNALRTARLYCAANHDDLDTVVRHIRAAQPSARIIATGLSLGASILGTYLTTKGADAAVDAACLVSVCWDYRKGTAQLDNGYFNRQIDRRLTYLLTSKIAKNQHHFADQYDVAHVIRTQKLRHFDAAFTARMFGFDSADHYYAAATISGRLDRIKVPTLVINSADDMLAPRRDVPLDEIRDRSSHVVLLFTERGGHIGFMEGWRPTATPTFYLDRVFGQYLAAIEQLEDSPRQVFA